VLHGLYLLWWVRERHVSPAAVAAILAAGDLALTALEVPTGWLADRYGHRVCLIAGSALQVAGMLCCWLASGISGLLSASVLIAFGDAFRSGADQALLYRSCLALNRETDFQIIEARTRAATHVALVALLLVGGVIVRVWGFAAAWIVETGLSVLGLIIAGAMIEPPAEITGDSPTIGTPLVDVSSPPKQLTAAIPKFAALIIPAAWLGGIAGAASFVAQTSEWATAERTTRLVAIATLAEAGGALLARRLSADLRSQLVLAGVGTAMLLIAVLQPSAFLAAVVGLSFLLGIAEPLRATAIQRLTADHVRARAASLASACDKAVATIALLVAGVLPRRQ
jgi:MFS family permease